MYKYLISYRKVEASGQKPDWASFTTQSEASLEARAIRERVERRMKAGDIQLVFNTPEDGRARKDSFSIRHTAITQNIPYHLTLDGAQAAIGAIEALLKGEQQVRSLQEYHADV